MPVSQTIQPCRLRRVPLAWSLTPQEAARLVRDDERPFALVGRWAGGGALIGSEPVRTAAPEEDPFAVLDDLLHPIAEPITRVTETYDWSTSKVRRYSALAASKNQKALTLSLNRLAAYVAHSSQPL